MASDSVIACTGCLDPFDPFEHSAAVLVMRNGMMGGRGLLGCIRAESISRVWSSVCTSATFKA
jgi:ribosomal protein L14